MEEFLEAFDRRECGLLLDNTDEQWLIIDELNRLGYHEDYWEPNTLIDSTENAMDAAWEYIIKTGPPDTKEITYARSGYMQTCSIKTVIARYVLAHDVAYSKTTDELLSLIG